MTTIRENIFRVTYAELGKPTERGFVDVPSDVPGGGQVLIDAADLNYIQKMRSAGYEPVFHISRTKAFSGDFVVVGRQWKS